MKGVVREALIRAACRIRCSTAQAGSSRVSAGVPV